MSLLGGARTEVVVNRKLVDATQVQTRVHSTHGPRYHVMSQVQLIPVNGLPETRRRHPCYTVVGAGKTAMDACLWLMTNGAEPERIRWIRPRDPWMLEPGQPAAIRRDFESAMHGYINGFQAIIEATSVADLFRLLESYNVLMRFDRDVEPRAYRAAVVSRGELDLLRQIKDVIRLGHVNTIEPNRIVLDDGSVEADPDAQFYIDCSATGIDQPPENAAVFQPGVINLLLTRQIQPVFSASLNALIESRFDDDDEKNSMCQVVPYPSVPLDWLKMWQVTMANAAQWAQRPQIAKSISRSRLDAISAARRGVDPADPGIHALNSVFKETLVQAVFSPPITRATRRRGLPEWRRRAGASNGRHGVPASVRAWCGVRPHTWDAHFTLISRREEWAMPIIEINSGTIHYEETGPQNGRPVVFVHGYWMGGQVWRQVSRRLAGLGLRCIAPTWPMGAQSQPLHPNADRTITGVAGIVAEVLEGLDLRDVVIVGNDSGGVVSQLVAVHHPERVGGLVLTSCDAFENFPPPILRPMILAARSKVFFDWRSKPCVYPPPANARMATCASRHR